MDKLHFDIRTRCWIDRKRGAAAACIELNFHKGSGKVPWGARGRLVGVPSYVGCLSCRKTLVIWKHKKDTEIWNKAAADQEGLVAYLDNIAHTGSRLIWIKAGFWVKLVEFGKHWAGSGYNPGNEQLLYMLNVANLKFRSGIFLLKIKKSLLITMARFGLISLNLIRSEGALSDCRNCIGKLVGGPGHTMVAFANFGVSPFGKDKVMTARKGWRGHGQPTSQWAGWCQGKGRGGSGLPGLLEKELLARWLIRLYPSITETVNQSSSILGKTWKIRTEAALSSQLEGRAQNQPGSDFQVEYWGKLFRPFPITLFFWSFFY